MKTVAVRFNEFELDDLTVAFLEHLKGIEQYRQRDDALELLGLWMKLTAAAREVGSYMVEDLDLPKWAQAKLRDALTTAGRVRELQAKVEALETRAKARGVTSAAQPPTVTRSRKKPAHKSKPKAAPVTVATEAGAVS